MRRLPKQIAQAGASVVINYTNNRSATDLVVSETKTWMESQFLFVPMSVIPEVKALFDTAITHFGKIDILINNAGTAIFKAIQDTSDEELRSYFAINVKGTFTVLREAATRLSNGGRIINISSSVTRLIYCRPMAHMRQQKVLLSSLPGSSPKKWVHGESR